MVPSGYWPHVKVSKYTAYTVPSGDTPAPVGVSEIGYPDSTVLYGRYQDTASWSSSASGILLGSIRSLAGVAYCSFQSNSRPVAYQQSRPSLTMSASPDIESEHGITVNTNAAVSDPGDHLGLDPI